MNTKETTPTQELAAMTERLIDQKYNLINFIIRIADEASTRGDFDTAWRCLNFIEKARKDS